MRAITPHAASGAEPILFSRRSCLQAMLAGTAAFASQAVDAQDLSRPTRIVLPYPAGNTLDSAARLFTESMRLANKRNYILDNKAGASGVIGTAEVARAKPDGSVLLYTTSVHNVNAVLLQKLPYDVRRDFTPISQLSISPGYLLLVRPDSPFKTVDDVVKAAKAKPGTIGYGSWGIGNTTHLIGAMFAQAAGVDLMHVPYRGSPLQDFMGGQFDLTWYSVTLALPLVTEGKPRPLATSFSRRNTELPHVPTLTELGYKDVDIPAWSGIFGPGGMDPALVRAIHSEIIEATRQPAYLANQKLTGSIAVNSSPEQFATAMSAELQSNSRLFPPLNIKMD